MSLKVEIESRPSQDDYDEKIKQCNILRTELTSLTEQMCYNEKLLEDLRAELEIERNKQRHRSDMSECSSQTDPDEEQEDVSVIEVIESTKRDVLDAQASKLLEDDIDHHQKPSTSTELPQNSSSITAIVDDDDELNNHPKVLYEDELIVFKEKCKSLSEENVRLQRELSELRATFGHFNGNWLHNAALKYLVPIIFVFIAYIFFFVRS
jgi:regulator of replication initiation timing